MIFFVHISYMDCPNRIGFIAIEIVKLQGETAFTFPYLHFLLKMEQFPYR